MMRDIIQRIDDLCETERPSGMPSHRDADGLNLAKSTPQLVELRKMINDIKRGMAMANTELHTLTWKGGRNVPSLDDHGINEILEHVDSIAPSLKSLTAVMKVKTNEIQKVLKKEQSKRARAKAREEKKSGASKA